MSDQQEPQEPRGEPLDELSELVQQLYETEQRILELTGGSVDAVVSPHGTPLLLGTAREQRERETAEHRQRAAVLNALPAYVALVGVDGGILAVNGAWERAAPGQAFIGAGHGAGGDYLAACKAADGGGGTDAGSLAEGVRAVLAGRSSSFTMHYSRQAGGTEQWFRALVTPLDPETLSGAVVTHIDVSDRERLEAERDRLLEAEHRARMEAEAMRAYYRQLFEESPVMFLVVEPEGYRIVDASDALLDGVGLPRDAILGQDIFSVVPPDDDLAKELRRSLEQVKATQKPDAMARQRSPIRQLHAATGTESERYWERLNAPILGVDGTLQYIIHGVEDVTEKRRQDAALEHALELLRIAGSTARIGGWIVDLRTEVLDWSEEVYRMHGVRPGSRISVEEAIQFYAPEYRDLIRERFDACRQDGVPFDEEMELISSEGGRFWVRAIGEPVRDEQATITAVRGAFQDISEAKRREADLARSEQRFRQFAEAMPFIVWTAEPDGTVDYKNGAFYQYTGLAAAKDASSDWIESLHPDDLAQSREAWAKASDEGHSYAFEFRIRRHDGAYRWHRVYGDPVHNEDDKVVKWYGSALDVDDIKTSERAAEQLAERLTTTLESIGDGFFTLDPEWRFTFINSQGEALVQRPRAALLGKRIWDTFPEIQGTVADDAYRKAMDDGIQTKFELYFDPLHTRFAVNAYPSEEGIAVYFRDVTAEWEAESVVRESEERFRAIAWATADAVWDWNLRTDEVWWSNGMQDLFGHALDTLEPDSASWTNRTHPSDRDRVVHHIEQAIDEGDERWQAEYRFARADGTYARVLDRGFVIRDEAGVALRMLGGMSDRTEQYEAEKLIQEQAALIDQAQDAIMVRDMDMRVVFWNRSAERMYGWTAKEVMGHYAGDLIYDDTASLATATQATLTAGEWAGQLTHRRRDGTSIAVDSRWTLLRDGAGQPVAVMTSNTDITERLKLEDQLRQAQRLEAVGQLTGGVAHDFNNLLTAIMGSADLLMGEVDDDQRELVELLQEAAQRGADLTQRLLAFARRQPLEPQIVDVNKLVVGMDRLLRRALGEATELETVRGGGLWQAMVDPAQLESAILNLCINARDAMDGSGRLTIETANVRLDEQYADQHSDVAPGQYVMLAVSDTGAGMAPEVAERVFEPFFTTKDVGKGSGLGLSMVYGFIKQSNGHVKVYSEPGSGTTVKMYLPRMAPGQEPRPAFVPATSTIGGTEHILVVEDDDLVRRQTGRQLESLGYRVTLAADGSEALDLLLQHVDIDLLLTDIVMPGGLNGRQVADRATGMRPKLRVLFMSGYTENAIVHHGRLDAGVHLLQKPFTRDDIARKVRVALASPPYAER